MKSLKPVHRNRHTGLKTIAAQGIVKFLQLYPKQVALWFQIFVYRRHCRMLECIRIVEKFVHQKRFSNPAPSIYRNKLRPVFHNCLLQKLLLNSTSNHKCRYLAAKIQIIVVLAK